MNKSAQEQRQSKSIPGAGSHREQEHTRTKAYRNTPRTGAHTVQKHTKKKSTQDHKKNKSTVRAGARAYRNTPRAVAHTERQNNTQSRRTCLQDMEDAHNGTA
jgi:hypothetical protein